MKIYIKKHLSLLLAALILFSGIAILGGNAVIQTVSAESANPYGLTESVADGAILHAWCWSFNTIKENLSSIAEAGFTSVQTSPINQVKAGDNGGMELMGNGKWYYHYQPTLYTIGNYQLGTKAEFESLCKEAKTYGIKIIVDVVANHCSSDYNAISNEIKNIAGGAFHDAFGIGDFGNRYQGTQGQLLSLWDLNTQNPNVQNMILNYLKECVASGASGFRYDAAKHTELPDEAPHNGQDFSSNFWPVVLNNGSEFQYGEILQGSGDRFGDYAKYMNVTASSYGHVVREAVRDQNFSTNKITSYYASGVSSDKLVTWVESHDNYTGDGSWSQLDNTQIRLAWALITARESTTPLFFSRPDGSSTSSQWGKNRIGIAGDNNYKHPEVVAVNQFRNAMVGQPENMVNINNDQSVLMIERGSAGAVIINTGSNPVTVNQTTSLVNGTYTDEAHGGTYTVAGNTLSGTVPAKSVVVIYDSQLAKVPSVNLSQKGGSFRNSLTLTLTAKNTDYAAYKINNGTFVEYQNGDTITIGQNMNPGDTVKITLTGKNAEAENNTVTQEYVFTKTAAPELDGTTVVYYDNSETNWDTVYLYAYTRVDDNLVNNKNWPGVPMDNLGDNIYGYIIDETWDYANVIFTNNNGTQFPSETGYYIAKGESKIFSGDGLIDYPDEEPTYPSTIPTENTEPSSSFPTTPTTTDPTAGSTEPSTSSTTQPTTDPVLVPKYGDVNLDGDVSIKDVTVLQQYLADLLPLNAQQKLNGNVDTDAELTIKDATLIQRYLADLILKFPIEE